MTNEALTYNFHFPSFHVLVLDVSCAAKHEVILRAFCYVEYGAVTVKKKCEWNFTGLTRKTQR